MLFFYVEDNIFTLTKFWIASINLGSFFWDGMDIILLDMVMLYFIDI